MFRHFAACLIVLSLLVGAPAGAQNSSSDTPAERLFARGMNAIRGSSQNRNYAEAIESFRKSADLGYAPAQVVLGYFYDIGFYVTSEPAQALAWYKKAAQQGDPLAAWLAGRLIYNGQAASRDLNAAAAWLQKSAGRGNPFAAYLLGLIRLEKNDYAQAAGWFQKAAEQGLPQAQFRLGVLLRDGAAGIKRDKFEAYVWLLMTSDAGYATPDLQPLESDLGTARTEEAKAKARKLEAQFSRRVIAHGCTGWDGEFDRIPSPPPPDIQQFCR